MKRFALLALTPRALCIIVETQDAESDVARSLAFANETVEKTVGASGRLLLSQEL